jgi:transposase
MGMEPPIPKEMWDQIPPTVQTVLLGVFQQYEQRIAQLENRVRQLEEQLGKNSTNSSRPPSTDSPAVKRAPPKDSSGRSRGGQPGHAFHARPLLPPDRTLPLKPEACRHCGHVLQGEDSEPLRHQVVELPVVKADVTEYQLHRLACPCCGTTTCAKLPPGVPTGHSGPRLQATTALLTGGYRLSKRQAETMVGDLFGIPLSAGEVCALEQQTSQILAPVVEELQEFCRTQPANIDETGWREERRRAWLWVVVTKLVTVFHIAQSRGSKVMCTLLGEDYRQILTSDRWSAYNRQPLRYRQVCWAHLQRDFQAMVDRNNAGSSIGEELLCCAQDLFHWWHRVRDGTLSCATFRSYMSSVRAMTRDALQAGSVCGCAKTAATCAELLQVEEALWTFVRVEGIEPTNNAAERAVRHAVQWRKISHGTDSKAGSEFVSRILSVVATCRQQGRHVLDYLTQCCEEALHGDAAASLLPQTEFSP